MFSYPITSTGTYLISKRLLLSLPILHHLLSNSVLYKSQINTELIKPISPTEYIYAFAQCSPSPFRLSMSSAGRESRACEAQFMHFLQECCSQSDSTLVFWSVAHIVLLTILEHQHYVCDELVVCGVLHACQFFPDCPQVHGLPHHLIVVWCLWKIFAVTCSHYNIQNCRHITTPTDILALTDVYTCDQNLILITRKKKLNAC